MSVRVWGIFINSSSAPCKVNAQCQGQGVIVPHQEVTVDAITDSHRNLQTAASAVSERLGRALWS